MGQVLFFHCLCASVYLQACILCHSDKWPVVWSSKQPPPDLRIRLAYECEHNILSASCVSCAFGFTDACELAREYVHEGSTVKSLGSDGNDDSVIAEL